MKRLLLSLALASVIASPSFASDPQKPIVLAQSSQSEYRLSVLEEQIRALNGKIEELNFRILELQEQLRRTQDDNNYRLEELENRQGNLGNGGSEKVVEDEEAGSVASCSARCSNWSTKPRVSTMVTTPAAPSPPPSRSRPPPPARPRRRCRAKASA